MSESEAESKSSDSDSKSESEADSESKHSKSESESKAKSKTDQPADCTYERFCRIFDNYNELLLFQKGMKEYLVEDDDDRDEDTEKMKGLLANVDMRVDHFNRQKKKAAETLIRKSSDVTEEMIETTVDYDELWVLQTRLETYRDLLREGGKPEEIDLEEYGRVAGMLANVKLRMKQVARTRTATPELQIFQVALKRYKEKLEDQDIWKFPEFDWFKEAVELYRNSLRRGSLEDWDEYGRVSIMLGIVKCQIKNQDEASADDVAIW